MISAHNAYVAWQPKNATFFIILRDLVLILTFVHVIDLDLAFPAAFPLPSCCFSAFSFARNESSLFLILIAVFEEEFYSLMCAHLFAHISSFFGTFLRSIFSYFQGFVSGIVRRLAGQFRLS